MATIRIFLLLGFLTSAAMANARDVSVTGDPSDDAGVDSSEENTWTKALSVGFTGSYASSSNVVGAAEGTTTQFGIVLSGSARCERGSHAWENTLGIQHTQTQTPVLDRFVKSADHLNLQSTYSYQLASTDQFGPFARLHMDTAVLPGYEVRTEDVTVRRIPVDGDPTVTLVPAEENIDLTGSLEPMVLKETLGIYAKPVTGDKLTVDSKLGIGLQQIVTGDGYAMADDGGTPELELVGLEGASEAGAEFEVAMAGTPKADVNWKASANFFLPVASSSEREFEGLDVLNTNISGSLSVKLSDWASLDYVLTMKRIPLVLDEWQVHNGVMLTVGFDLL